MLHNCVVLASEGTHPSGEDHAHALTADYRERGIHVTTVEEPGPAQSVHRGNRRP